MVLLVVASWVLSLPPLYTSATRTMPLFQRVLLTFVATLTMLRIPSCSRMSAFLNLSNWHNFSRKWKLTTHFADKLWNIDLHYTSDCRIILQTLCTIFQFFVFYPYILQPPLTMLNYQIWLYIGFFLLLITINYTVSKNFQLSTIPDLRFRTFLVLHLQNVHAYDGIHEMSCRLHVWLTN